MTFVYGWKMEVEVVMTPYEEVYMAGRWRLRLL